MNINTTISSLQFSPVQEEATAYKAVYFLGIGGIGMSALARYFHKQGCRVSGYDKTATPLTVQLVREGISVHYIDDISLADTQADLVVYTPAVPVGHKEFNYFKDNNYTLKKRSEVLGDITKHHFNIAVAGTHGKTTTSAMIAHLLQHTGFGCNAFLGGIATNYSSNYIASDSTHCVVEADEYDRSFLALSPSIAVITAMDADHLDIYGTEENMQNAFIEFTQRIKPGGSLYVKKGLKRAEELVADNTLTYHITDNSSDIYAKEIKVQEGSYCFDIVVPQEEIKDVVLQMGGRHNIENCLVTVAIGRALKIDTDKIKAAVVSFKGVKRRFENIIASEDVTMIDDYAHHPEEVAALLHGAKELYPARKTLLVFQPHLFTRTRDHAAGFAGVMKQVEEAILLPIYPAREEPIEGVNSEMIADNAGAGTRVLQKEALLSYLQNDWNIGNDKWLILIAGAGDIDNMVLPIKQIIETKIEAKKA